MRPDRNPRARTQALGAIAAMAIAAAALGGCASRGTIVGKVRPASPDVVVMAWPVNGKPPRAPADTARVVQARGRFEPRVLVVQAGATVRFENRDRTFHNAFSVTPGNRFDLGPYRPGQSRQSDLDHAGVLKVFCELHPKEIMTIVVVPDRWHTRPVADGTFVLTRLPHGEYMLRAWHPTRGQVTTRVAVPSSTPALLTFGG